MATSLETFRALIPEFAAQPDATVEVYLTLAVAAHNTTVWGNVYVFAMIYYAAHAMALDPTIGSAGGSATAGALTSQKDGDLSRGYGSAGSTASTLGDAWLARTTYGQQYLQLRGTRAKTGPFAISLDVL
jgi:hypothetical protein